MTKFEINKNNDGTINLDIRGNMLDLIMMVAAVGEHDDNIKHIISAAACALKNLNTKEND